MKKLILIAWFMILPSFLYAQDVETPAKNYNALSPRGYTGGFQIGTLLGIRRHDEYSYGSGFYLDGAHFSFQTSHGYRFNPYLAVSGVAELNFYEDMYLLPLLASVKATLRKHRFTPFVVGEAGYALELTNNKNSSQAKTYGGRTFGGEIGLQFPTPQKTAFTVSFGLRNQKMYYEEVNSERTYETTIIARRFHFRLGMTF